MIFSKCFNQPNLLITTTCSNSDLTNITSSLEGKVNGHAAAREEDEEESVDV